MYDVNEKHQYVVVFIVGYEEFKNNEQNKMIYYFPH